MTVARAHILVTGGAGFIGSHFVRAAHEAGSRLVILDDRADVQPVPQGIVYVRGDIADRRLTSGLIREHRITAVVHFAGKIQVAESMRRPELYFDHNLIRTHALLDVIRAEGPAVFLFSSSAAVYGAAGVDPVTESTALAPVSPYGMSKLGVEHALGAYGAAMQLRWAALRYFNAAGAHPDGTLREAHDPETHLIPLAIDAARGSRPPLALFGDDHATPDGTCIRDYVHVCDIADAHLAAVDLLSRGHPVGAVNLGSGIGVSVRDVIRETARVLNRDVPYTIADRRPGDPAMLVAHAERAAAILGWRPRRTAIATIVDDAARSRAP